MRATGPIPQAREPLLPIPAPPRPDGPFTEAQGVRDVAPRFGTPVHAPDERGSTAGGPRATCGAGSNGHPEHPLGLAGYTARNLMRLGGAIGLRAAGHLALAGGIVLLSYVHPPWHAAAYAEMRQVLLPAGAALPPGVPLIALILLPALAALMAWNAARLSAALARVSASPVRPVVVVAVALVFLSVAVFPFLSHDLELYHAHAKMLAEHGVSPYRSTPRQVLGSIPRGMPWPDQLAPYGPVPLVLQAVLVGRVSDPLAAAIILKALAALPTLLFVILLARWRTPTPAARASAIVAVGWQPLPFLELGGMGHIEGWVGLASAFALLAFVRGRVWSGTLLLSAAALVKLEALLFVPLALAFVAGSRDQAPGARSRRLAALAAWPLAIGGVVFLAYIPLGGLGAGLDAIRVEASKTLRSVPQAIGFVTGTPGRDVAWLLRWVLALILLVLAFSAWRRRTLFRPAALGYAAYLCLGKSFLQPWHLVPLVHLAAVAPLAGEADEGAGRLVALWSVSAVLGGYTYLFLAGSLAPREQTISTLIMLLGPLAGLAWMTIRR